MRLSEGIQSGAVLQRNREDVCEVFFTAEVAGNLRSSLGKAEKTADGRYLLTGIPVGGPYRLTLNDDKNAVTFENLYVGDLWMLAGQSNMEGAGRMRERQYEMEKHPDDGLRAFYMDDRWDRAKLQLHQPWASKDAYISDYWFEANGIKDKKAPTAQNDGVGPGYFIGKRFREVFAGVPQGLIACGVGGTSLWRWDPDEGKENCYTAAVRRFRACGSHIRGMIWDQGEGETKPDRLAAFPKVMDHLFARFREDFGDKDLPIVQVQINRFNRAKPEEDILWSGVREAQRILGKTVSQLSTVASVDCGLDDTIHLSADSQEKMGRREADAMLTLLGVFRLPPPELDRVEWKTDGKFTVLSVCYKTADGGLQASGEPSGFSLRSAIDGSEIRCISHLELFPDRVDIVTMLREEQIRDAVLFYGYGNGYYCNLCDSVGYSLPAFGGFSLKNAARKD